MNTFHWKNRPSDTKFSIHGRRHILVGQCRRCGRTDKGEYIYSVTGEWVGTTQVEYIEVCSRCLSKLVDLCNGME